MFPAFLLWAPVFAYMAMIFGLSSLSRLPPLPTDSAYYGVHVATYSGLGLLTARALARGLRHVSARNVLGAILIGSLYGISDEYHQMFVPGRHFDVLDMLADGVGAAIGGGAAIAWSIIRPRQ